MMNFSLLFLIIVINSLAFVTIPVKSQSAEKPAAIPKSGESGKPGAPPKPEGSGKPEAAPKPDGSVTTPDPKAKDELKAKDAELIDFPYQVFLCLKTNKKIVCGGSILNESFIITAAHCMYKDPKTKFKPQDLIVVAGQIELKVNEKSITRNIKTILKHPLFAYDKHLNDVALLQLSQKLPKSDNIKPIRLNEKELTGEFLNCDVIGWGTMAYADDAEKKARLTSQTMKRMEMNIMTKAMCVKKFAKGSYKSFFTENTFCTNSYPEYKKAQESCQVADDSGGPLICNKRLIGIVSYVMSCKQEYHPTIYADVFKHSTWIKNQRLSTTSVAQKPGVRRNSKKRSSSSKHFFNKYLYLPIIVIAFKF